MALHFNCVRCGQALMARIQYAGMQVSCPVCNSSNVVPLLPQPLPGEPPAGPRPLKVGEVDDPELIDMEKVRETPPHGIPAQNSGAAGDQP